MKIGDIGRATYEEDEYDGCLIRITDVRPDNEYDVVVLEGPKKGSTTGPWYESTIIPLSPLEQLAMEATNDE
jgi:hypothetical protein